MQNTSGLQPIKSIFLPGLALLLTLTSTALAQETGELGRMWTFENPPLAYLEKEYGFNPDENWLDSLRLGSLRLGGKDNASGFGSASFVSPNGLIMTSTRCVRDAITQTRPRDLNIITNGFVAKTLEQEIRLRSSHDEWLTAAQLVKITNVTDKVNKGVLHSDNETQIKKKREANKQTILDAARNADTELVPRIVSLYQGAVVQLYQYKVYDDLRLVVLPHMRSANFGGTRDNFTWPCYSLDFAFLRAYEDGKPADTSNHYFKWKSGGAKKDELVFVSGNPGTTKRLSTRAQLELERDIRIPMRIQRIKNNLRIANIRSSKTIEQLTNILRQSSVGNTDSAAFDPGSPSPHFSDAQLLKMEYDIKAARGNLQGLKDATLMAQKTTSEQAFQDRVMADKDLAEKYGDLWDRIASVVEQRRQHEARARFQTANGSPVLGVLVPIVRMCDPAETEEHREQARRTNESWAGVEISPNAGYILDCLDHLVRSRSWLAEDDPFFTKVHGGRSAADFWDAVDGEQAQSSPNWLGYPEPREALANSGWKAIQASEDPMVVAAHELARLMRANEELGVRLDAEEAALGADIGRLLLKCYGANVSPDGTNTLRFTDGVVKGSPTAGTISPHRTTFDGLYGRSAEFDNKPPFNLPKTWLDRKDAIDMTKTVNFASTNDISVGNSGSVVVNKELEVVGVVVDGNIESLHNDFVFTDEVPRAVSTHVDGIMEALVKIYGADRIAKELTGE